MHYGTSTTEPEITNNYSADTEATMEGPRTTHLCLIFGLRQVWAISQGVSEYDWLFTGSK